MIKRILCPVDFSDTSCNAAKYAMEELAPQLGAEIIWVTVLETSDIRVALDAGLYGFESDADLHRQVEGWIERQFARVDSDTKVHTTRDVRRGLPEREILEAIGEHQPQLIVMGSNGIARRVPIGSKTEHVIRHSDVPVVVLRAK